VSPLLGFRLITATSGILSGNPDFKYVYPPGNVQTDFWAQAKKNSQMWTGQDFSNVGPDFRLSGVFHMPSEVLEKILACKMWLLSSLKLGSLTFSPLVRPSC